VESAIRPDTILIAIMYANNELGTVMPVRRSVPLPASTVCYSLPDATQAVGRLPVDVNGDNIDILSFSAHKMYGPKGVGALYVRRRAPRVKLAAQQHGGGHEKDLRSGTLNVPGIVGLGKACELCRQEMQQDAQRLSNLRDHLQNELLKTEGSFVNGNPQSPPAECYQHWL
jgi:cysteine desulfurase